MEEPTKYGLLSAIAPLFKPQLEDVATEGLCYILGSSERARATFARFLSEATGLSFTESLSWKKQDSGTDKSRPEDKSRPDLVGTDAAGRTRIIIEAKFWADLTPNQPGTYLERLRKQEMAGAVVVIGPERRLGTLWAALREACPPSLEIGKDLHATTDTFSVEVLTRHRLTLVSWRSVIGRLLGDAEAAGALNVAADLRQLEGLISRVDEKAFLPIQPEELSDRLPARVVQYVDVATMAVDALSAIPSLGLKKGKGLAGGLASTFWVGGSLRGVLGVRFDVWAERGWTPMWLQLDSPNGKAPREVSVALGSMGGDPRREVVELYWGPAIPILLPVLVERSVVVQSVVDQVRRAVEVLRQLPASIIGGPAKAVEPDEPVRESDRLPQSAT